MAVKTTLTAQEDFTGEFPSAWAGSGLWRFNESEPDTEDVALHLTPSADPARVSGLS